MPSREEIAAQTAKEFGLKEGATPGPWTLDYAQDNMIYVGPEADRTIYIAQVWADGDESLSDLDIANAVLLAAAPALRDALIDSRCRESERDLTVKQAAIEIGSGFGAESQRMIDAIAQIVRRVAPDAESQRLRDALAECLEELLKADSMLSLIRHRGSVNWGGVAMATEAGADKVIGSARRMYEKVKTLLASPEVRNEPT